MSMEAFGFCQLENTCCNHKSSIRQSHEMVWNSSILAFSLPLVKDLKSLADLIVFYFIFYEVCYISFELVEAQAGYDYIMVMSLCSHGHMTFKMSLPVNQSQSVWQENKAVIYIYRAVTNRSARGLNGGMWPMWLFDPRLKGRVDWHLEALYSQSRSALWKARRPFTFDIDVFSFSSRPDSIWRLGLRASYMPVRSVLQPQYAIAGSSFPFCCVSLFWKLTQSF